MKMWIKNNLPEILINIPPAGKYVIRILAATIFITLVFINVVSPDTLKYGASELAGLIPAWYTESGKLLLAFSLCLGVLIYPFLKKLLVRFLSTVYIAPDNILLTVFALVFLFLYFVKVVNPLYTESLDSLQLAIRVYFTAFLFSGVSVIILDLIGKVVITRILAELKSRAMQDKTDTIYANDVSDDPITQEEDDLLGRKEFIDNFYSQINNLPFSSSFVFGLQGDWGEGKSSVLNLLANKVKADKNQLLLRFEPWFFNDEEALLKGFLRDFELVINSRYLFPCFRGTIHKYGELILSPVKKALPINIDGLSNLFEDETMEDVKNRLTNILQRLDTRIIVFIDDIDRLPKEEILQVLKLVKLVSNFPNTTFILSFDQEIVNELLISEKTKNKFFLDKIIQKVMCLPKADQLDIDSYVGSYLEKLINQMAISDSEKKTALKDFNDLYTTDIKRCFNTLRKAKRYLNSLRATLASSVVREINTCDLLVLEVIRVFFPELFEDIWKNRWYYFYGSWDDEEFSTSPIKYIFKENDVIGEIKSHIENQLKIYTPEEKKIIMDVLSKLFLSVDKAFNKQNYDFGNMAGKYRAERRIAHPAVFRKYFLLKEREEDIPDSEVKAFISLLNKSTNEELKTNLEKGFTEYQKREKLLGFIQKLDLFNSDFSKEIAPSIISSLYEIQLSNVTLTADETDEIFVLIYRLLNERVEHGLIQATVVGAVEKASLYIATKMVNWATSGEPAFYNVQQNVNKDELKTRLDSRLTKLFLQEKKDIFETNQLESLSVLANWGKCLDLGKTHVNQYVRNLAQENNVVIAKIISVYVIYWDTVDAQIEYNNLINIFDEEYFYSVVKNMDLSKLESKLKTAVEVFIKVYDERHKQASEPTVGTPAVLTSVPTIEVSIDGISSSQGKYTVSLSMRNVGKESAILDYLEISGVPRQSLKGRKILSLTDQDKVRVSLEGTDFQKGVIENPELTLVYKDINGKLFKTVYKIKIQKRDDKLVNFESLYEFQFAQL